jgi:uncharacterized membrane protein (UPF0127 family)
MVVLTALTIVGLAATRPSELPRPRAEVKGAILQLEVAREADAQARGLSSHASLEQHQAMLFPRLDGREQQCFWMHDMTFPIDILWLNDDARIVQIQEHFAPESYPQTVCGPTGTAHALELRAGAVDHFEFERGDHVLLTL